MKKHLPFLVALVILFTGILSIIYGKETGEIPSYVLNKRVISLEARLDTIINQQARSEADGNGSEITPIRQGFPYCEPFTGSTLERPNTVPGGDADLTAQPGQNNGVLQLTNISSPSQLGYAFIDLPFSSTYGIKVSFEYFIYNPDPSEDPGDGISFFLYDGAISATDFRIGGLGGSLGFSPHGYSGGGFTDFTSSPPLYSPENLNGFGGLLGGYLGVGFDVYGKFGNEYERRYGGFLKPNDYYASHAGVTQPRYPNSVIVRGPEIIAPSEMRINGMPKAYPFTGLYNPPFNSYQFKTGKITNKDAIILPGSDVSLGTGSLPDNLDYFVSPMFELSSAGRVDDCSRNGYRKVFIDFKPVDPSNPNTEYQIKVDMLINDGGAPQLIYDVINSQFDPGQTAPATFKLGFAGATGSNQAFQEIRNVTAQVSNEGDLQRPRTQLLDERVCIDEVEFFELDVNLQNINAQIQCIQLYQTEEEALDVQEDLDDIVGVQDCDSGICFLELCKQERLKEPSAIGEFEAFIFLENGIEVPKIKFSSNGTSGSATIWYTVTDNFGQISEPKPITITIDPLPVHKNPGSEKIDSPSCDGQQDGAISNVIFSDVIDGFSSTASWIPEGSSTPLDITANISSTPVSNGQTTLSLANVNLGTYTIVVTNPAGCSEQAVILVDQEQGTPVVILDPVIPLCEGGMVTFVPEVDQNYIDKVGSNPNLVWYSDISRIHELKTGDTEVFIGNQSYPVTSVTISASGELTIDGLLANGVNPLEYKFYVEVEDFNNPNGANFCALDGDPVEAIAQVGPGVTYEEPTVSQHDWCLNSEGIISVTDLGGGNGTYFLELLLDDANQTVLDSKSTNSAGGEFSGLQKGKYFVRITSGTPPCITTKGVYEVLGPDEAISINQLSQENPSCSDDNGVITFEVFGGTPGRNPAYTFTFDGHPVTPTLESGVYKISGIAPATSHTVVVADSNKCVASFITQNFDAIPIPIFIVSDDEICPSETAVITVDESAKSNATNIVYSWTNLDGTSLTNGNGVTYTQNVHTGELTITGLTEDQLSYKYQLQVTGDNVCIPTSEIATVTITPTPVVDPPAITPVSCNGGSDGVIEITPEPATASDYEYSIDAGASYQNSSTFSGLPSGTYTIRVRSKIGSQCYRDISDLVVDEPAALMVSSLPQDPTCGNTNGEIEVTVTGGVTDYTIRLMSGSSVVETQTSTGGPVVFVGLAPNTYNVAVTDAKACAISETVTLTDDPGLTFTVEPMSDEICFGQTASVTPVFKTNGTADITWYKDAAGLDEIVPSATPDANGLIFRINSADNTLIVEGLSEGNHSYYLGITGINYCPYPLFEAEITVFKPLEAIPVVIDETCFQAADGSITINATGADGNFTYSLDGAPFVSTNIFTELPTGSYTIDVQSANGCDFQVSANVGGPTAPITTNTPDIIRESCNLGNGVIENLVISGGWGNYNVEWRRGSETGTVVPGDEIGATDLLPDTYYLIVIDEVGCRKVFDFTVDAQPLPSYQMTQDIAECAGVPIKFTPINTVSGSSPTEVKWYKGPNQTNEIQSGIDPSNPDVVYTMEDSDWVNPSLEINGLPAGRYTYYFYVECTGQEIPVEVELFPIPDIKLSSSPETCFGAGDGKIFLTTGGGSPSQLYFVDNGQGMTQSQLEDLSFSPKPYNIRVEQAGVGCPANFQVEVFGPSAELDVAPLSSIDPGCGSDIGIIRSQITGGWAPYEVTLFKDGEALNTQNIPGHNFEALNLAPGEYYLSVEDAEGCLDISNTVTLVYGPSQVLVDGLEICEGDMAVLKPTINPANANVTFEWFKNSALTIPIESDPNPDVNGQIFQIDTDGTLSVSGLVDSDSPVTYYVRAIGSDVCPGFVASPTVGIFDQPTVTATTQPEICFGDKGSITLTGAEGSGNYEYSLDGTTFQEANVFQVAPGTYEATVRSGGCENVSSPIVVTGPSEPITNTAPIVSNPTCGQANGVIQFTISGGYGSYSIESFMDGTSMGPPVSTSGNFELLNLLSGDYTFNIIDGGGCSYLIESPITLVDGLTPLSASNEDICEGEVASLTPNSSQIGISPIFSWYQNSDGTGQISNSTIGNLTYQIYSDGTLNISGLAGADTPYVYYVGISGQGTCPPPLEKVEVMVYPIPNLRVSNPSIVCDPSGTVDLTEYIEGFNSSVYDYQIESPSGSDMRLEQIQSVNESGSYVIQSSLKGANCWTPTQRILVKISGTELVPEFNYQFDLGDGNILVNTDVQILEPVDFLDISLGDVVIWDWDFGDGGSSSEQNPTHTFDRKGIFTVTLTTIDLIGCVATYQRVIEVKDDYLIIVPNAFTPSGTKNLYFKPQFRGISAMEFYVFNTWGELIFESTSLDTFGWDGTWKGKETPNGNYVYKAIFTTRAGLKVEKAGVFILIR